MADVKYGHRLLLVVNLIDYAEVPDAEAPTFAPRQLEATGWSRLFRKLADGIADTNIGCGAKLGEFLLGSG
jgi:hypothetical protein